MKAWGATVSANLAIATTSTSALSTILLRLLFDKCYPGFYYCYDMFTPAAIATAERRTSFLQS